jgi:hypothetical protein
VLQTDILNYFSRPGMMTGSGTHSTVFDNLPTDIPSLCQTVQANLLHIF